MARWTGRLVSVLVVMAVAGTPALGATCAWLCGPGVGVAGADTAHQGDHDATAAHCHDAADTATPAIVAPSDTPCPMHRASSRDATMAQGGLRSDAGAVSMAPVSKELPFGGGPGHVASPVISRAHPRHRPPSQTPLVLRL